MFFFIAAAPIAAPISFIFTVNNAIAVAAERIPVVSNVNQFLEANSITLPMAFSGIIRPSITLVIPSILPGSLKKLAALVPRLVHASASLVRPDLISSRFFAIYNYFCQALLDIP